LNPRTSSPFDQRLCPGHAAGGQISGDDHDRTHVAPRIELDRTSEERAGALVLTVVKLLHELLERQALRRIDAGSLSDAQTEKFGPHVDAARQTRSNGMRKNSDSKKRPQSRSGSIRKALLKKETGHGQQSVPHALQSSSLSDVLERVLDKGIVIAGDIKIKIVDIELLSSRFDSSSARSTRPKEMAWTGGVNNPVHLEQAPRDNWKLRWQSWTRGWQGWKLHCRACRCLRNRCCGGF